VSKSDVIKRGTLLMMKIEFSFGTFHPAKNNFVGWLKFYVWFWCQVFHFFFEKEAKNLALTNCTNGEEEKQRKNC
jgi:hypothetical protein